MVKTIPSHGVVYDIVFTHLNLATWLPELVTDRTWPPASECFSGRSGGGGRFRGPIARRVVHQWRDVGLEVWQRPGSTGQLEKNPSHKSGAVTTSRIIGHIMTNNDTYIHNTFTIAWQPEMLMVAAFTQITKFQSCFCCPWWLQPTKLVNRRAELLSWDVPPCATMCHGHGPTCRTPFPASSFHPESIN